MNKTINLREDTCAQCGKEFERTPWHMYRMRNKEKNGRFDFFCSYTCMRKAEENKK